MTGGFALIRFVRRLFAMCALLAPILAAAPAGAHPHVWVDARAEIVFDDKGEVTGIRHIWQFDKEFTSYATLNLDKNNDGKLSMEELQPLADTNMDALKEYDFFTSFYIGTRKLGFAKPTEYWLDFHGGRLTLFYTLPLQKPVAVKDAMIEIGDPEYFVAITFVKGQEVKLDGAPKGCTASYTPPHDLDMQTMAMLGSIPASQHDLPPELVQAAASLSNVVQLHCPKGATASVTTSGDAPQPPKPAAAEPVLRPTQGTLTATDTQIAASAPAPVPPSPAPAPAPERVVILDQNNNPPQQEPPVVPDALPSPPAPQGFLGWLAGLWHSIFG
jgi:ABC-type uncharacterized transport system substrate-binding protein